MISVEMCLYIYILLLFIVLNARKIKMDFVITIEGERFKYYYFRTQILSSEIALSYNSVNKQTVLFAKFDS